MEPQNVTCCHVSCDRQPMHLIFKEVRGVRSEPATHKKVPMLMRVHDKRHHMHNLMHNHWHNKHKKHDKHNKHNHKHNHMHNHRHNKHNHRHNHTHKMQKRKYQNATTNVKNGKIQKLRRMTKIDKHIQE